MVSAMRGFLEPSSVAVIGASNDPTRIGGRPIRNLLESGYAGRILPVNPNRSMVQGLESFPTVADLPLVPDVAVIALGRDHVEQMVVACGDRGIASAIVFAAGYAETGAAGRDAQASLALAARRAGVRLLGPNANGIVSVPDRSPLALTPILAGGMPPLGPIAVATQSAAVGSYWLRRMRDSGAGLRYWVHTGNEADIGLADAIECFLDDPAVETVLCVLEQWREADRLPGILERIEQSDSTVIVLPIGRTEAGRRAALSHTGVLVARQSEVVGGMLKQVGAIVVQGMAEAFEIATSVEAARGIGPRVGILTSSGGLGVLLADAFATVGFRLPTFHEELQARWRLLVPFCSPANPVDVTAQVVNEPGLFIEFARDMVASAQIDVLVAFLPHATLGDARTQALKDVVPLARSLRVAVVAVGTVPGDVAADLRAGGVAVFTEPEQAALVLSRLPGAVPSIMSATSPASDRDASEGATAARRLASPRGDLALTDELAMKAVLRSHGLPVVTDIVARSVEDAVAACETVGYPVVVKRHRPGIAHKAVDGGVVVGVEDAHAARDAARRLLDLSASNDLDPDATLLVEPMILGDELFVGVTRDEDWGPLGLIGIGGTAVESAGAMAFRRLPLDASDVTSMLEDSPTLAPLFGHGPRAQAIPTIGRILAVLGAILSETPRLRAIELNPVIVMPNGRALIVDALGEWQ